MIFIVLSWLCLFTILLGLGSLLSVVWGRITRCEVGRQLGLFRLPWLGLAAMLAIVQILSLLTPINGSVLIAMIVLGLLGLPTARAIARARSVPPAEPETLGRGPLLLFLAALLVVILVGAANLATSASTVAYDTDLYHASWVRWANQHPAVPGLANLHSRLGFNAGFLLFSPVVDNLWWDLRSAWFAQGFFVVLACMHWLSILLSVGGTQALRVRLFALFTMPYLLLKLAYLGPGLNDDTPTHILLLVLVLELLRYQSSFSAPPGNSAELPRNREIALSYLVTIATLGFLFKPMGAVSLGLTVAFVVASAPVRRLVPGVVLPALLLTGYFARNVVLSGWLLYPAPVGGLAVDWAVPAQPLAEDNGHQLQSTDGLYRAIKAFARAPGAESMRADSEGAAFWYPQWYQRFRQSLEPRLLFSGTLFFFAYFYIRSRGRQGKEGVRMDLFLTALAALNLLFWFSTAPDLRFGDGFFWAWMGLGASMLFTSGIVRPNTAKLLGILFVAQFFTSFRFDLVPGRLPASWPLGKMVSRPTRVVRIENGQKPPLEVHVPSEGEQCGDAPLPCTPYPISELKAREPGSPHKGFWIDVSARPK